ncbi:MAG: sigma-70 family RNA polymerase sigma factor, partial [Humibacillus sp.]|nr:sigma-70 family RNA polymerase sigma factor [Humibacillus sp.]
SDGGGGATVGAGEWAVDAGRTGGWTQHVGSSEQPEQPESQSGSGSDESTELSDSQLVDGVRNGSVDAYATLWARHEPVARALARRIAPPREVDDLVSESFLRVLRSLRDGRGPQTAFQAYLLSTLRRINIDSGRRYHQRVVPTDDDQIETAVAPSSEELALERSDERVAWSAWASLPEDSRTLLWALIVDEQTPAQLAESLGTTANAVASRAKRARERLRQAFLNEHVSAAVDDDCRLTRSKLGAYVRSGLSTRDRATVENHLEQCPRCRAALVTVIDVGQTLRVYVAPLVAAGAIVGAAQGPFEVGLTAGASTASTSSISSAVPWVISAKGAALPVAAAGTVVAAAVAVVVTVLPNQNVQLDAAPYGSTPGVTSIGPSGRAPASSTGMPETVTGIAPPPVGSSRSTRSGPVDPTWVDAPGGTRATARSSGSAAARSKRSVNAAPTAPSRLRDTAGQPNVPVAPSTTSAQKPPQTPSTSRLTTVPSPVVTTAPPTSPVVTPPATQPPPPTAPTATPVQRSFVFRPATQSLYRARLEVPAGWLIRSVRHDHPGGPYEHVGRARRSVDRLLVPGALSVTVSGADGAATAGQLEVRFTDLLGRPVDGGATRSLG